MGHGKLKGVMIFQQLEYLPPGRLFAFLYNLRQLVLRRPTRVVWDRTHYIVTDRNMPHHRLHLPGSAQKRLFFTYNRGVKHGVTYLAQLYQITKIKFSDGDIVLDCGAHMGDIKLYFDLLPKRVRYIGFEADPDDFAYLTHNIKQGRGKRRAEAFNVGLWRESTTIPFYISPCNRDSSFIQPAQYDRVLEIPARPLADFMPAKKSGRVRLLKCEAEGAELEVLQGLGDKLAKIDYIAAELGFERGVHEESTFVPVVNFLLKNGFEIAPDHDPSQLRVLFRNTALAKK